MACPVEFLLFFNCPAGASARWDSGIPDVIGVGFATENVTGGIRRRTDGVGTEDKE